MELKDLIKIHDAAERHRIAVTDILLDASEGKLSLFTIANKAYREVLIPCIDRGIHEASPVGTYIHQFEPLFDHKQFVQLDIGQILEIPRKHVKELVVNQKISEVELYRHLVNPQDDFEVDFWKSEREVFEFQEGFPTYPDVTLEDIYVSKQEYESTSADSYEAKVAGRNIGESASDTSLKVIGLLMHHLAKSPKYASGSSPNKSQIKELLLELAAELNVSTYRLNKVDERLLTDAMKYLEEQKL